MPNEPIKHHYIPQFILKNFANEKDEMCYTNKSGTVSKITSPDKVFFEKNLYRNAVSDSDDPVALEKSFAKFECEIAPLFSELNK